MNDAPILYPHQVVELEHLLGTTAHRLIAWEMGVGKGVLVARYGASLGDARRLYVAPASCRRQVERELKHWSSPTHIQVIEKRNTQLSDGPGWIICSYDALLSDNIFGQLINQRWALLVLDEAHIARTMSAQRTQRLLSRTGLATKADRVIAMTGTPIVASPKDIYPLMARLFPRALRVNGTSRLMNAGDFEDAYCTHRTVVISGGRVIQQITGGKNLGDLRQRLAPYMTRLKRDRVLHLPKLRQVEFALSLGPDAEAKIEEAMGDLPLELAAALHKADDDELLRLLHRHAAALATLRRTLGELKADTAAEHIETCIDGGTDRLIGFFHHRSVGAAMLDQLRDSGIATAIIHGATPAGARARTIDAFTAGDIQVLLLQSQVGSLGLNLQCCRRAIVVEPDWADSTTQQSLSRIYRAGQTRDCIVEFALILGTLDERIVAVARRKAQTAAALIETPVKESA